MNMKQTMFFLIQRMPVPTENAPKSTKVVPDREILSPRAEPRHSPLGLTHVPNVHKESAPTQLPRGFTISDADTPSRIHAQEGQATQECHKTSHTTSLQTVHRTNLNLDNLTTV